MEHELTSRLVEVADDQEAVNELYLARRWSDGLPVIAPTIERVRAMLRCTDYRPGEIIATLPPGQGDASVERIAVNAVLAGCHPSYLPVLIAAVQAVAAPELNLQALQTTTNAAAVMLLLNGPVTRQLDVNSGGNCLGQGWRANATLGRALRLILQNVGRAIPGEMDLATVGQPGKYTFCCAENEARSPWEPLHVERGFPSTTSTVTVIGVSGTLNLNSHDKDADELLRVLAHSLAYPTSNDYYHDSEPFVIVVPEHAEILARAGLGKLDVKRRLWEGSHLAARYFAKQDLARLLTARGLAAEQPLGPDTLIPLTLRPESIGLIVAGGVSVHSVYLPTFGDTRSVTRAISDVVGQPIQRFGVPPK